MYDPGGVEWVLTRSRGLSPTAIHFLALRDNRGQCANPPTAPHGSSSALTGENLPHRLHPVLRPLTINRQWLHLALLPLVLMTAEHTVNAADPVAPAEILLTLQRPLVIAHRGYSHSAPENTLPSFKLAKTTGADLVELDYHHTKDGVLIVIHDGELDRTTDAVAQWGGKKIRVADKTLAELRTLDAGQWFDAKYTGTRLPTLTEALDLIQDGNVTLIERKAGEAATCVKLLRDRQLINHVVVQSFDWKYLQDFHQQEPRQILAALGPPGSRGGKKLEDTEKILSADWIEKVRQTGARVVVWNRQITRKSVTCAHQQGMRVWVYTIDDPVLAQTLRELGADGIISNDPSTIQRTVAIRDTPR
jgi:glycerophosphoryl diester phosphodiesterase